MLEAQNLETQNLETGTALADRFGYTWKRDLGASRPQRLIQASPIGMSGGREADDLAFSSEAVEASTYVFNVVADSSDTPLIKLAR